MTFAIVNLKDGRRTDLKPFLLDNDAFPTLENAYLFRGRIQRRSGYSRIGSGQGRLRWSLGTTGATPFTATVPNTTIPTGIVQFSIGSVFLTDPGGASPVTLLSTDPTYSGTLDRATGNLSITIPAIAGTDVWYYPGLPVMGLRSLDISQITTTINDQSLVAFDTRFSYLFDISSGDFIGVNDFIAPGITDFMWGGQDWQQFYTCNYYGVLWTTNNNPGYHASVTAQGANEGDGIRWFIQYKTDGTLVNAWSNFNPQIDSTPKYLMGALIIVAYKDRLICLNTWEGRGPLASNSANYSQRVRWSQNGTPFYSNNPNGSGTDADAWRQDIIGKGGYLDAPTSQDIVGAEFIKDTLVVYFERSTWQLVYTGNEILPFIFQKINTELGSESTFSIVPFDRGIYAIGNYGIITTDSVNVVRIDQKIPDEVFQIQSLNHGANRVSGIRDYNSQLVYFSYPIRTDEDGDVSTYDLVYPNQVLVYNYLEGSWAEFDDSFTCFGYWEQAADTTWANMNIAWNAANIAWDSQVLTAKYPYVVAGNQRGFVFVISQLQQLGINSPSLEISQFSGNVITCPNHNLVDNQYVLILGCTGYTDANTYIYKIGVVNADNFTLIPPVNASGYTGGGVLVHMPNITITTKEFNPFFEDGSSVRLKYFDVYTDRTDSGQLTIQTYNSSNSDDPTEVDIMLTSPEPPTSFSQNQDRIWHRVYTQTFGSFFQNTFTLSDSQMKDMDVTTSPINIQGLIYYTAPAGRGPYDL